VGDYGHKWEITDVFDSLLCFPGLWFSSRVRLERADVWLLVRGKSHEIKNIKNYDYNFYFVQIQF
jgi:hypothetical protein